MHIVKNNNQNSRLVPLIIPTTQKVWKNKSPFETHSFFLIPDSITLKDPVLKTYQPLLVSVDEDDKCETFRTIKSGFEHVSQKYHLKLNGFLKENCDQYCFFKESQDPYKEIVLDLFEDITVDLGVIWDHCGTVLTTCDIE